MPASLTLLLDDHALLVVDKPAGLRSTREGAHDRDNAEAAAEALWGGQVWAVHQLDRDTSGVLLMVRKKALLADWQRKLAGGSKRYLAVVHGTLVEPRVEVDVALRRDWRAGRTVVADDGQAASTSVRRLASTDAATAVLCMPRTGRTHQIRAHLAHLGHPLFGDRRYGAPATDGALIGRHALHLWRVKVAGRELTAPVPPDLLALGASLGLSDGLPGVGC